MAMSNLSVTILRTIYYLVMNNEQEVKEVVIFISAGNFFRIQLFYIL